MYPLKQQVVDALSSLFPPQLFGTLSSSHRQVQFRPHHSLQCRKINFFRGLLTGDLRRQIARSKVSILDGQHVVTPARRITVNYSLTAPSAARKNGYPRARKLWLDETMQMPRWRQPKKKQRWRRTAGFIPDRLARRALSEKMGEWVRESPVFWPLPTRWARMKTPKMDSSSLTEECRSCWAKPNCSTRLGWYFKILPRNYSIQ